MLSCDNVIFIIFALNYANRLLMKFTSLEIPGVWLIEPNRFGDDRGYFEEAWKKDEFEAVVGPVEFVQDNESLSRRGVLRGLHYQRGEASQAKLVRVSRGTVIDVAVDLRRGSSTYGRHVAVELSASNGRQLFIPRGFAHGFLVMSDEAQFQYKVDNRYAPETEASIRFDDPDLAIKWPVDGMKLILSPKDMAAETFKNTEPQ